MNKELKLKIENAIALVASEEDGSSYLRKACSMKDLKLALSLAKSDIVKDVISDAITIKRILNK